jgi:hypothetical protein
MANTLTGLIPIIYAALDKISRELVGFIPSVYLNAEAEKAAKDQTIRYPIVASRSAADITPAATGPNPSGETVSYADMTISKSRSVTFPWNGEEQVGLGNLYNEVLTKQFAQAMRTLVNEVETDLASLYVFASRAYGTAGTTPFASTLADTAQLLKILLDNSAPRTALQMVINTTAGAALRTLAQLTKANEAGGDDLLRRGILLDLHSFKIRESAQISAHTKGAGASYQTDGAVAVGVEDVVLDTGSGTVLAGDVVTFADEALSSKYIVGTGVAAAGTISLNKPGAVAAIGDDKAMTIGNSFTPNMAFDRDAIHLVTRVPAKPEGGDAAEDAMVITDPVSGLSFLVSLYRQYHQVSFEVGLAWGYKAVKSEHIALLLG